MKNYKFTINGKEYSVSVAGIKDGQASVNVNGVDYTVDCANADAAVDSRGCAALGSGEGGPQAKRSGGVDAVDSPGVKQPLGKSKGAVNDGVTKVIEAPLPGVILNLYVMPGQNVKRGDKIAVLEAMKMENDILAPIDGTIKEVFIQRGDSILEGAKIATIA